ncbi:MAG: hypothetical protein L0F96_03435 [Lactococcus lactis]|nr:hypothetical protein [Lactococcus lactis]MDN5446294.1 hypothetical protein [Lactococcus lactis]
MCDFGLDWSESERKAIMVTARKVLESYEIIKRRSIMMSKTPIPDIKGQEYSEMPKSQNLSNSSESRIIHYIAAKKDAEELEIRYKEIERAVDACTGDFASLLRLKFIAGKPDESVWYMLNYSKSWYYETGIDEALCLFAETWESGRIPREITKRN